jgi:hypothetical protein
MTRTTGAWKFEAVNVSHGASWLEEQIWMDCALNAVRSGATGEEAVMRADYVTRAFTERTEYGESQ